MLESTITSKGQTTLPKKVRDALGVKPGDKVRYFLDGSGGVRVLRVKSVDEVAGFLSKYYDGPPLTLEEIDSAIDAHLSEKFGHLRPKTHKAAE